MILKDENGNILMDGAEVLKDSEKTGTIVKVGGQPQTEIGFDSDPQQQITKNRTDIDNLIERSGTNITVDGVSQAKVEFVGGQPQTQIDSKLDKTQCTLDFNQLFDANKSTLPSGSGLVITNIFGGHHVGGTTTSQFYHKMYSVNTISGHKYYFAANFSEKANVYIVAKAGSTSFNTKDEKIFTGDTNFNITLQVERDKVINTDLKPILVDLTRMFGIGKEPQTTQEVQEYLVKGMYYPYDDKPSKAEVNENMMGAPSLTIDNNVYTKDIPYYEAPTDGYLWLELERQGQNEDISLEVYVTPGVSVKRKIILTDKNYKVCYQYTFRKGQRIELVFPPNSTATINKSIFVYPKEV